MPSFISAAEIERGGGMLAYGLKALLPGLDA